MLRATSRGVLASVVLVVLGAACSGGDEHAAQPSPVTTTNVSPSPTVEPSTTAVTGTPSPEPTTTIHYWGPAAGVWIFDPTDGHATRVYEGPPGISYSGPRPPDSVLDAHRVGLSPPAAEVGAIWVYEHNTGESVRHALDGVETRRIPGVWEVIESVQGALAYRTTEPLSWSNPDLVLELPTGEKLTLGRPVYDADFSPAGRWLWMRRGDDDGSVVLAVLDALTGVELFATDVGACQCDGGTPPTWSATGRFLSYIDYTTPGQDGGATGRVLDTASATTLDVYGEWVPGADLLLRVDSSVGIELIDPLAPGEAQLLTEHRGEDVRVHYGFSVDGTTMWLKEPDSDATDATTIVRVIRIEGRREVARAESRGDIVGIYEGEVIFAKNGGKSSGCISIFHPAFVAERPCGLVEALSWTPDGVGLVLLRPGAVTLLDVTTGEETELVPHGLRGLLVFEWSTDGKLLLWWPRPGI